MNRPVSGSKQSQPTRRRDHWFLAAFLVAYAAALLPIWWPRFLPLLDQPNHLALAAIWHRMRDPSWNYQQFYQLNLVPVPYWGYYLPVHLLAYVFPIELANKIYLSLYALSLPAAVLALARTYKRSAWLSLLSFPFIFSYSFKFGFLQFCAGIPMALGSLVVLQRYLRRPSVQGLGLLLVCTVATFLTHVVAWLLLGLWVIPVLLAHAHQWRRSLLAAATLLLTVVLAIVDFRYAAAKSMVVSGQVAFSGRYLALKDRFTYLGTALLTDWPGVASQVLVALLFASGLVLWAVAVRAADRRRRLGDFIPECCLGISLFCYAAVPFSLWAPLNYWNIGPRFLTPAALFLILCIPGTIAGLRRLAVLPALGVAVLFPLLLARQYRDFNTRAAGMVEVLQKVPRGSSILTLIREASDPAIAFDAVPFTEFHSYAQLLSGGFNPFQLILGFPIAKRPDQQLPAPHWARPSEFQQDTHGHHYDYVLTYREQSDWQLFGDYAAQVPLVTKAGDWRLYASKGIH